MADSDGVAPYLEKAERLLRWGDATLNELVEHGEASRLDDLERCLFYSLALICSLHECLASCAKKGGQHDWRAEFNELRSTDSLLLYLWKARDADIHAAVKKWEEAPTSFQIRIVNFVKAARIVFRVGQRNDVPMLSVRAARHLFGVSSEPEMIPLLKARKYPSKEAQQAIGVEMRRIMESLNLLPFETRSGGKLVTIPAPFEHLGEANSFSADAAVFYALRFYRSKYSDLRQLLSASTKQPIPQAAPA